MDSFFHIIQLNLENILLSSMPLLLIWKVELQLDQLNVVWLCIYYNLLRHVFHTQMNYGVLKSMLNPILVLTLLMVIYLHSILLFFQFNTTDKTFPKDWVDAKIKHMVFCVCYLFFKSLLSSFLHHYTANSGMTTQVSSSLELV